MPQPFALTTQQMYTGHTVAEPESQLLMAGPLTLQFQNGSIRYIKWGDFEIIRMVYAAVRDQNWLTISPVISAPNLKQQKDQFAITFTGEYRKDEIHFSADYKITGSAAGAIRFAMAGRALTSFLTNRIGLCVLHPITGCAGEPVQITETNGQVTEGIFPEFIQPYQPFKNMAAMRWQLPSGGEAILKFTGEIFETEDQRNWTDASYKTYSTPLEKPFPVRVQPGQEFHQTIELTISGISPFDPTAPAHSPDELIIDFSAGTSLPEIGVSQSTDVNTLTPADISKIKALELDHYRVDVKVSEPGWESLFSAALAEAKALVIPLLVALHLSKESEKGLSAFIQLAQTTGVKPKALLLLPAPGQDYSELSLVWPVLRSAFPDVKIGTGTNAYFAELNRRRPPAEAIDFLSYSVNPQVHASDQASLTENLAAQADTVRSARQFAGGKDIYVSPVTLKPRFNPDATGPVPAEEALEAPVDVRQMSLYGAGWTLGSLKYLAEAGAAAITFFETAGRKGLFLPTDWPDPHNSFPRVPGVFPVYVVLQELLAFKGAVVHPCRSSWPLAYSGLVLVREKASKIFLANHTSETLTVLVKLKINKADVKILEAGVWEQSGDIRTGFAASKEATPRREEGLTVSLNPYATLVITGEID